MYYNITNITGPVDLVQTINSELLQNLGGVGILVALFMISFIQMAARQHPPEKSFLGSMFVTTMSGFFLYLLDFLAGQILVALILMLIFSIFLMWRGRND
jgi:membrane protein CcdC involved in cytochrome C biogenesis